MFEVIISAVNTGRVQRCTVATREQAETCIEDFMQGGFRPRNPRNYRVEVHAVAPPGPTTLALGVRPLSPEAAA